MAKLFSIFSFPSYFVENFIAFRIYCTMMYSYTHNHNLLHSVLLFIKAICLTSDFSILPADHGTLADAEDAAVLIILSIVGHLHADVGSGTAPS